MHADTLTTYEFACGDVLPGCAASFADPDLVGLLGQVQQHAAHDHGIHNIPDEVLDAVQAAVRRR